MALPHLSGITSSETAASPLLKCQVSMGKEGTHRAEQSLSTQSECSILPWQAPSNIHFLKELGD